jgi:glyoxylase-like metal-dependent hydrolase (beta-lactamase superfamily II)
MDVTRIADGLWRWSTYYGEWRENVGCLYVEVDDAIVLIDPLVPEEPGEEARFWEALDRDVARCGLPVHVLVTVFWHTRSAARMIERYAARVHAVSGARAVIARRAGQVHETYRGVAELPGGIVAYPTARRNEVVFWLPAHAALATGDVILGAEDGGLRFCPASWLPPGIDHASLRESLQPLRALPVERVLVSRGCSAVKPPAPRRRARTRAPRPCAAALRAARRRRCGRRRPR